MIRAMLDVRYSHLYFYQSLNRLQRGLSAIAELLVKWYDTIFVRLNFFIKYQILADFLNHFTVRIRKFVIILYLMKLWHTGTMQYSSYTRLFASICFTFRAWTQSSPQTGID